MIEFSESCVGPLSQILIATFIHW